MKNCTSQTNAAKCSCTSPCSRKGVCCECVAYHSVRGELPACYFTKEAERTYDRSIDNYLRTR